MASITIALTGDIYPTRHMKPLAPQVQDVFKILRDADVAVGNFEIALSDKGVALEKLMAIRADPTVERDVPELGLDVVTVANNHSVDYGWLALEDSIGRLKKAGLRVVGAGRNIREAMRPHVLTVKGIRVGVIAFSCLLPTGMAASRDRAGLSPIHVHTAYEIDPSYQMEEPGDISAVKVRTWPHETDLQAAAKAISQLKAKCDFTIVSIHWGFGSGEQLADYQWPLARALIDAGADVIHGHHPHAIHPVGYHAGKPIFFSPNVLVGQQIFLPASPKAKALWSGMSADGYVACLRLAESGAEIELVPTLLDNDRLPRLATGSDRVRIIERLRGLSAAHGAHVFDKGEHVGVAGVRGN